MKHRTFRDPYQAVINQFNKHGVRYVVIGMAGINYYAESAKEVFGTMDYDVFIDPAISNVRKAIAGLERLGFSVRAGTGLLKPEEIPNLVRQRKTIVATTVDGIMVELLLQVSGYPFSELCRDAATFTVNGVPVKVGRLTKLLYSKRVSGRPKDRAFLKRYELLLKESHISEKKSSRRSRR